ncbi:MAG: sensor histidine kinase [Chitinophagales bacterium]
MGNRNRFVIFYLIILYVFAFLFWWTYLLYDKTVQHYEDAVSLQILISESNNQPDQTDELFALEKEFKRQRIMVVTEGIVFFLILLYGLLRMRKSIVREMQIANQQKNFMLSITHELKSPLSSIKLMNETLLMRELPKDKKDLLLHNSLSEVDRLEGLVENILLAAKIENDSYGFSKQDINISSILNELIERFKVTKKVSIVSSVEDSVILKGDKAAWTSIAVNLIENAIKYCDDEPQLNISLKKENDKVFFSIADNGCGIADEEKGRVFEKFYRIGNEETRKAKGTGLGLYIVDRLVKFHNGKIEIKDNQPKGSVFVMHFSL